MCIELEVSKSRPISLNPPRGRGSGQRYNLVVTDRQPECAIFFCCCDRRSDGGRNGDRCRYVAGSNRAQLLSPISIRLPPASCAVEGDKMGCGGGHEQYTSSAPGLHGSCLSVADTGIHVPWGSHWEVWVWQRQSSQVERWLCPECGGQRDGIYGDYWCVLIAGGVWGDPGATADGRRCGEKPRPYWERRYLGWSDITTELIRKYAINTVTIAHLGTNHETIQS